MRKVGHFAPPEVAVEEGERRGKHGPEENVTTYLLENANAYCRRAGVGHAGRVPRRTAQTRGLRKNTRAQKCCLLVSAVLYRGWAQRKTAYQP